MYLTKENDKNYFVNEHQQGGIDDNCMRSILSQSGIKYVGYSGAKPGIWKGRVIEQYQGTIRKVLAISSAIGNHALTNVGKNTVANRPDRTLPI